MGDVLYFVFAVALEALVVIWGFFVIDDEIRLVARGPETGNLSEIRLLEPDFEICGRVGRGRVVGLKGDAVFRSEAVFETFECFGNI